MNPFTCDFSTSGCGFEDASDTLHKWKRQYNNVLGETCLLSVV